MKNSQILKILKKQTEDSRWFSENYEKLRSKYEGRVLAIKDKKIVSDADTVDELVNNVEKKGGNMGLLLIETIPPKNISFIL